MAIFDLTRSPFALLDVGIRDTKDQVVHAEEERAFEDGADERALSAARTALTVARERLKHELAWLPELSPNRARAVVAKLREGAGVEEVLDGPSGLSRLNLLADLLARFPEREQLRRALIEGHKTLDPEGAREAIHEARRVAGYPPVSDEAWTEAMKWLIGRHAEVFVADVTLSNQGPVDLADLMEDGWFDPEPVHFFRNAIIARYDRWSEPKLSEIGERINRAIEVLRADPANEGSVAQVDNLLQEWDRLSQPVQLNEQAQGLDEPKSMELFRKLRDLTLWLANDQARFKTALGISNALHRTFPELPSVMSRLEEDIGTLEGLIEGQQEAEILDPLALAVQEAKRDPATLANQVEACDFAPSAIGSALQLYRTFSNARARSSELSDPDLPWAMVRSVGIMLNNLAHRPEAALKIIEGIFQTASANMQQKLVLDRNVLRETILNNQLEHALKTSQLHDAKSAVSKLAELNNSSRHQYVKLQSHLDEKIRAQKWGWVKLGLWAAVIGGMIFFSASTNGDRAPDTPIDYDYSPGAANLPTDVQMDEAPGSTDIPTTIDLSGETAPQPRVGQMLTRGELRYCQFESARLDAVRNRVPNFATSRFNERIEDYNRRCGSYRYSPSDWEAVQRELDAAGTQINRQANELVIEWRTAGGPMQAPSVDDNATPQSSPTPLARSRTNSESPDATNRPLGDIELDAEVDQPDKDPAVADPS